MPEKEKATGRSEDTTVASELPLKLAPSVLYTVPSAFMCTVETVHDKRKRKVGSGARRPEFESRPCCLLAV